MATLSTGPVAPGDAIDKLNKTLVMKSCNADGLILKPSRPAFPVDPQLWQVIYRNNITDYKGPPTINIARKWKPRPRGGGGVKLLIHLSVWS